MIQVLLDELKSINASGHIESIDEQLHKKLISRRHTQYSSDMTHSSSSLNIGYKSIVTTMGLR